MLRTLTQRMELASHFSIVTLLTTIKQSFESPWRSLEIKNNLPNLSLLPACPRPGSIPFRSHANADLSCCVTNVQRLVADELEHSRGGGRIQRRLKYDVELETRSSPARFVQERDHAHLAHPAFSRQISAQKSLVDLPTLSTRFRRTAF